MQARTDSAALGQAAGTIWCIGRANPVDWQIRTPLGSFTTEDRASWHTHSGERAGELRRSRHGRHWYLAPFEREVYRGRYDDTGWHAATERRRVRQLRSYQLPLAA